MPEKLVIRGGRPLSVRETAEKYGATRAEVDEVLWLLGALNEPPRAKHVSGRTATRDQRAAGPRSRSLKVAAVKKTARGPGSTGARARGRRSPKKR